MLLYPTYRLFTEREVHEVLKRVWSFLRLPSGLHYKLGVVVTEHQAQENFGYDSAADRT